MEKGEKGCFFSLCCGRGLGLPGQESVKEEMTGDRKGPGLTWSTAARKARKAGCVQESEAQGVLRRQDC